MSQNTAASATTDDQQPMDRAPLRARNLVDTANGEIDRRIFVDEGLYRREITHIFNRAWLYVGHESQIPNPGDFVLSRMGDESVILNRDSAGTVHVFLNSCRHRGMKVCRYDEGNTRNFVCPYHSWAYRNSGELLVVPDFDASYQPPFDKSLWSLVEVGQLSILRGTVWATWDAKAPSFRDYLGDAWYALDKGLAPWDGSDDETELLGSPQKWRIPSNWKIVAENFAGDVMHNVSHASVDRVGIGPNNKTGRRDSSGKLVLASYPGGHGAVFGVAPADREPNDYEGAPSTAAYFLDCWRKRKQLIGEQAYVSTSVGTIFPNMSFHGRQPRTILVAHPLGPAHTEMWRVYFVDKKAPPEVKEYLRHYYMRYSGPGGMTEQDDMENWNYASASCRGSIAQAYPFNYKNGLNAGGSHPLIPGTVTENPVNTEQNVRGLYHRWAQMLDEKN